MATREVKKKKDVQIYPPWRCTGKTSWCGHTVSGSNAWCGKCGGSWERCSDPSFQPPRSQSRKPDKNWDWNKHPTPQWDWQSSQRKEQQDRPRTPRKHKEKKKAKEKEKDGKDADPYTKPSTVPAPWESGAAASSSAEAANVELVNAIKQCWPDQALMPKALREVVEKQTSAAEHPQMIQELRKATTQLDRNQKLLVSLTDARQKHRESWLKHMTGLIQGWQAQLKTFQTQQEDYSNRLDKARAEVREARTTIQRLNAQIGTEAPLPAVEEEAAEVDKSLLARETDLQQRATQLLSQCVQSAEQVAIPVESGESDISDMETEDKAERGTKRHCSREPVNRASEVAAASGAVRFTDDVAPRDDLQEDRPDHFACCSSTFVLPSSFDDDCMFPFQAVASAQQLAVEVGTHLSSWTLRSPVPRQCHATDEVKESVFSFAQREYAHEDLPPGDPLDTNLGYLEDLRSIWEEHGTIADEDEGPVIFIQTWYIHHEAHPIWHVSRPIKLTREMHLWHSNILTVWDDLVQPDELIEMNIVDPLPPQSATEWACAHVILTQGLHFDMRANLLSVRSPDDLYMDIVAKAAFSLPPTVSGRGLADVSGRGDQCEHADCVINRRDLRLPLNYDQFDNPNGAGYVMTIFPSRALLGAAPGQPPVADVFREALRSDDSDIDMEDAETNALDDGDALPLEPHEEASPSPGSPSPTQVLGPALVFDDRALRGSHRRHARLHWYPYRTFITDMARLWGVTVHEVIDVHTTRVPLTGDEGDADTVSVVLQLQGDLAVGSSEKLIILDVEVHEDLDAAGLPVPARVQRSVNRIVQQFTRSQIIILAGVHRYCNQQAIRDRCLVTLNNAGSEFSFDVPPVRTVRLVDALPPSRCTWIDFSPVRWCSERLNSCRLPSFVWWPDGFEMPSLAFPEVLSVEDWDGSQPLEFIFYTDGSRSNHQVGAGIVMLFRTVDALYCGGLLSSLVDEGKTANDGEHAAMVWALLWSYQLSNWFIATFATPEVEFSFLFDSQVAGYQTSGAWRSFNSIPWNELQRGFVHILRQRHGQPALHFHYTPAHDGEYWNETADLLAKFACSHPDRVPTCDAWWFLLREPALRRAFQHIWMWEAMVQGDPAFPTLYGDQLCHVLQPCHDAQLSPHCQAAENPDAPEDPVLLDVKCATANVLSLSMVTDGQHLTSTARQLGLLRQFHDQGYHLVAIQESRLRRHLARDNEFYHIVHAPALASGHEGVQIWFSLQHRLHQAARPFRAEDVKIVFSSATTLIVKVCHPSWKFLLVNTHAPHGDHPDEVQQQHWQTIDRYLRPYLEYNLVIVDLVPKDDVINEPFRLYLLNLLPKNLLIGVLPLNLGLLTFILMPPVWNNRPNML
eukprot:Skav222498  [mRNA]  locus=scaffold1835:683710:688428:+ [translate_table: standard]